MFILLTGGTGQIGRALLPRLLAAGHEVRCLVKPSKRTPNLPPNVPVQLALGRVEDERALRGALAGVEVVIHLASAEWLGQRGNLVSTDVEGTRLLAAAAAEAGVKRLVYVSHLGADRASGYPVLKAKGIGYVPAEKQVNQEQVIGIIPVDSIFSPIMKVNYLVEDTRVGQRTDFDRLILEVHTDGSINPYEAISEAAAILQRKLSLFTNLQPPTKSEAPVAGGESQVLDTPIEDLQLSVRSLNCLKRAGIRSVGELLTYSEEDIMKLKNFGQKSLDEIKDKLAERSLALQPSTPD